MYCPAKVKFLITIMCFFWVALHSDITRANSNKKQEQVVIVQHTGAFGAMGSTLTNITFPFLQTAALRGIEVMLEGKTHDFTGKSTSEMVATSAGIAAGGALGNATATALDHGVKAFTLVVEPIVGQKG